MLVATAIEKGRQIFQQFAMVGGASFRGARLFFTNEADYPSFRRFSATGRLHTGKR